MPIFETSLPAGRAKNFEPLLAKLSALLVVGVWVLLTSPAAWSQTLPPAPREFLTGADISFLPYYEKQGVQYLDAGKQTDFLSIAKRNGWNILRVRLWVDPAAKPEYEVSNLANVTLLGRNRNQISNCSPALWPEKKNREPL